MDANYWYNTNTPEGEKMFQFTESELIDFIETAVNATVSNSVKNKEHLFNNWLNTVGLYRPDIE